MIRQFLFQDPSCSLALRSSPLLVTSATLLVYLPHPACPEGAFEVEVEVEEVSEEVWHL